MGLMRPMSLHKSHESLRARRAGGLAEAGPIRAWVICVDLPLTRKNPSMPPHFVLIVVLLHHGLRIFR
jgi:hypothetical protein